MIAHRLATQNVDDLVEGIEKEGWRKLCRGLLRRDPLKRWGSEQVSLWLANERDYRLAVEDEVEPNEFQAPPILYYGKPCPLPKELLIHLRKDWGKAEEYFASGTNLNELVEWLRFKLGMEDLADAIKGTDTDITLKTIESRTFSYIQTIAKFTGDHRVEYKGRELSPETIKQTAECASNGDRAAGVRLLELHENGVVLVAGKFETASEFSKIASNWHDAIYDYRSKVRDIERNGARAPALEGDTLVKLLAASIPVSSVVHELRSAAHRAITSDARECSWFRNLGDPSKASLGAIMIMPHVIRDAEAGARKRRSEARVKEIERRRLLFKAIAGGVIVVFILAIGYYKVKEIQLSRQALVLASAKIENIIPQDDPPGSFFMRFVDGSGGNFHIFQKDDKIFLFNPSGTKCSWTLSAEKLGVGSQVIYESIVDRNFVGKFFKGHCGGDMKIGMRPLSEKALSLQWIKGEEVIADGTFDRSAYDSSERNRISTQSARVWASDYNTNGNRVQFEPWANSIVIHVEWTGNFVPSDNAEFQIIFPNGGTGNCPQRYCSLAKDNNGSYSKGTYILNAKTRHRNLASSKFVVR